MKLLYNGTYRAILGLVVVLLSFGYFFAITFIPIPHENQAISNTIMGVIGTGGISAVLQFFFGNHDKSNSETKTPI